MKTKLNNLVHLNKCKQFVIKPTVKLKHTVFWLVKKLIHYKLNQLTKQCLSQPPGGNCCCAFPMKYRTQNASE